MIAAWFLVSRTGHHVKLQRRKGHFDDDIDIRDANAVPNVIQFYGHEGEWCCCVYRKWCLSRLAIRGFQQASSTTFLFSGTKQY